MTHTPLFEARQIRKTFPGVEALKGVHFDVRPGEIHALVGVNGAGKTTLIKIMTGAYPPTSGDMYLRGQPFAPRTAVEAIRRGIVAVHQERTLIPRLSVARNILLGVEPTRFGLLDERRTTAMAQEFANRMGVQLPMSQEVRKLGEGERQLVDILRALHGDPALILLDEPTAALSRSETEHLFRQLDGFRAHGIGIVFVSHRLNEVFAICDRLTVLRDGAEVMTAPTAQLSQREVVRLMINRDVDVARATEQRGPVSQGVPLLRVGGLSGPGFQALDLEVHSGEVVGLAGAVGAGCTAMLETIVGQRPAQSGQVWLRGKPVPKLSPGRALAHGVALLPEKRSEKGLVERLSVKHNIVLASLRQLSWAGVVSGRLENQAAKAIVGRLRIATPHLSFQARNLSGGNKQKLVFGKWLLAFKDVRDAVFLFDEPTEGVDVTVKAEMWDSIRDLARAGAGVLVASSELEELLQLSDRICVVRAGRLVGDVRAGEVSPDDLLRLMLVETARAASDKLAVE